MKKHLLIITLLVVCFASCRKETKRAPSQSRSIPTETTHASAEVLYYGGSACHFYDIAITADYYAFLNHYSDTFVQVFHKGDMTSYRVGLREEKEAVFEFPSFVRMNYKNKRKNVVEIWDNNRLGIKRLELDKGKDSPLLEYAFEPFPKEIIPSSDIHITKPEVYATSSLTGKDAAFYSYNSELGYYYATPYPIIPHAAVQSKINPYVAHITVSEGKDRIVAALRYINTVDFYDLNGDIRQAFAYGETYIYPEFDAYSRLFNLDKSTKCFIDVCSTDKYVYCLYDGTTGFSASSSVIVVFDWEGNHIKNITTGRNLRRITASPTDESLIAIASNEAGGRDVLLIKNIQ